MKNWQQFEDALKRSGIYIEYKHKGQTDEVQGISFKKGKHSFKGSDIDRKFSYSKLDAVLNGNSYSQEQQQITVPEETRSTLSENIVSGITEAISGIGNLFDIK